MVIPQPSRPKRQTSLWQTLWRNRWPYLFVTPFFVLFLVFGVYPIVFSVWISLHRWNGAPGREVWVGLENYQVLLRDGYFWESMLNTLIIFVLHFPIMLLGAVLLAVALNQQNVRWRGLWRALIFMPHLTSMVAAGITFRMIFERDSGIANGMLGWFGVPPVPWIDEVWWARISVSILLIWAWTGYQMVLVLAGLQTIPQEVNEAAMVDGASPSHIFWRITLPLLRPVLTFLLTMSLIGTFALYTEPTVLTRGGPIHATTTPTMEITAQSFSNLKYGYAAALSYVYFAVVVVATVLHLRLTQSKEAR